MRTTDSRRRSDWALKAALFAALVFGLAAGPALRAAPNPPQGSDDIPASALMTPEELVKLLSQSTGAKPRVIFVGFRALYLQAHIPGSEFVGPAARAENLQQIRNLLQSASRKKLIVLYCGCCPWSHCPNVRPAYRAVRAMGFTRLKVLDIPQDFGRDWLAKEYPVQTGE